MGKYIDPEIGIRLAEIRRHRGLTQRQLATAIGVTLTSLQNYERGRNAITDSRLGALACARCVASRSTC
jgi:transcriptional regulator with XRE-family HTH domain